MQKKRVLIITYYWPPSGGAGVQRWLKFAKYLRSFNWEPLIYTPENPEFPATDDSLNKDVPEGITIIKQPITEPYSFYKFFVGQKQKTKINAGFLSEKKKPRLKEKISVWIRGNFFIPDARKFWIKPSIKFLLEYLKANPVDVIASTGPPHSMHMIALGVTKKLGIQWLADFRDPWTNIDFYNDLNLSKRADKKHRRMELEVLKHASEITVISPDMKADFTNIFNRDYKVITNGYDTEDIVSLADTVLDKKFTITYIGTLVKSRNPAKFWSALASLVKENDDFAEDLEIKLIGTVDYAALQAIKENNLESNVTKIDYLPHKDINPLQQKSRVLLLIINDTPNANMILPGKFFEYIAADRPILCLGPDEGDAAGIIKENKLGKVCGFNNEDQIKEAVIELYSAYKGNTTHPEFTGKDMFSRKVLTKELAGVFDSMIKAND